MTKEEVIKTEWEKLDKKAKYDYLGWSLDMYDERDENNEIDFTVYSRKIVNGYFIVIRPKSLQGIENNNGWIKIESEADLSKEIIDCFFYDNVEKAVVCGNYNSDFKKFNWSAFFVEWSEQITHYQPINKPKPPIY